MKEEDIKQKDLKKRVESLSVRTFTIAGMAEKDFQRFIKFCELNAKATKIFYIQGKKQVKQELIYSIGIRVLLDAYEADGKFQLMYDKIEFLENELFKLKQDRITSIEKKEDEKPNRRIIKTMGRSD